MPPLKSPHDASAGRVPGQFPQRVKRGRKGSRRTDVKLSLQCQKEEAATRHKITKILVQDAPKKAYANAQYSEIMTLDKFAEHISTHGSKYNRADIQAVLIQAVDCMREQLLAGQRIQMGDLGTFSIHINSMGAESLETYNPAIHVEDLNVRWKAGTRFLSLLKDSVFNLVPTRKAAKLVVKALKAGKNTVDLTGEASGPDDKTEENA